MDSGMHKYRQTQGNHDIVFSCFPEGLKRRREEHQLVMQHHWRNEHLRRCRRIDEKSFVASDTTSNAAESIDDTNLERQQTTSHLPSLSTPPSLIRDDPSGSTAAQAHHDSFLIAVSDHLTGNAVHHSSAPPAASPLSTWSFGPDRKVTLTLRSFRVSVVRGDYSRRYSFVMQPTFACTWSRGTTCCKACDGVQAESEVHETVRCQVISSTAAQRNRASETLATTSNKNVSLTSALRATPGSATVASFLGGISGPLYHNEESSSPEVRPNVSEDVMTDGYFYEATQISHRHCTPPRPTGLRDITDSLVSCSSALFVDCLIQCTLDEAAIAVDDRRGWVHLYRGHHITSEVGRARLVKDILEVGCIGVTSPTAMSCTETPSLTICLFRRC